MSDLHTKYMHLALLEAEKSLRFNEIPVGAIVVHENKVVGVGYNQKEHKQNATRHAEIIAIEHACETLGSWRLSECTLYVTLEPCVMCSGAIIQSHLANVVIGAQADKQKGLLSLVEQFPKPSFNHYPEIKTGILEEEAKTMIKDFFKLLRK